uniref:fructose-bisphosphatase n=1 Tax=Glossina pallidipes TaxID=7398 RepID=A0A1A9Z1I9_GLOPL
MISLQLVVKIIRYQISLGNISKFFQKKITKNIHGEKQIALDIIANNSFKDILQTHRNIAGIASEEEKKIVTFTKQEKYVDGSSNADINIPIGTIFSIYPRISPLGTAINDQDFLQPGNQQIMSGYVLYGSSTTLVFTIKSGVHIFTYHPSYDMFILSQQN